MNLWIPYSPLFPFVTPPLEISENRRYIIINSNKMFISCVSIKFFCNLNRDISSTSAIYAVNQQLVLDVPNGVRESDHEFHFHRCPKKRLLSSREPSKIIYICYVCVCMCVCVCVWRYREFTNIYALPLMHGSNIRSYILKQTRFVYWVRMTFCYHQTLKGLTYKTKPEGLAWSLYY